MNRPVEVHFYEWSVARWRTSATRLMLDAAGRGVYRELLDACYTQGSILNPLHSGQFLEAMARDCGVTPDTFRGIWELIRHHFVADNHDPSRLRNKQADCVRHNYILYIKQKRINGQNGGRKNRGRVTSVESMECEAVGNRVLNRPVKLTNITNITPPTPPGGGAAAEVVVCAPPEPAIGETADALCDQHPKHSDRFLSQQKILEIDREVRASGIVLEAGCERVTDSARFWAHVLAVNKAWCGTEDWRKQAGWFVPPLWKWLDNHGWLVWPPGCKPCELSAPGVPAWYLAQQAREEAELEAAGVRSALQ